MAGHWNVSITSCCLSSLTVRAVCGLVLSFIVQCQQSIWCIYICHGRHNFDMLYIQTYSWNTYVLNWWFYLLKFP
jgi:hypothetical protein